MKDFLQKLLSLKRREEGFTLTELLVSMFIFSALAAIAVPIMLNQRAASSETALKTDLANAALNVESFKSDNGGVYPDKIPDNVSINSEGAELKYTYPYDRRAYCLQIISGDKTFFKSNEDSEATTTDCTYEYVVPSTKLTGVMDGFKPTLTWRTVATATTYVIYKNNIPVKTINIPADSTIKATSYTLPAMNPEERATFYIVVQDGATSSAQSNSVTLTAPIPTPVSPVVKIIASEKSSSTMQEYTLQWSNVKYTSNYQVWNTTGTPVLIVGNIGSNENTAKVLVKRGTTMRVVVRAINSEGVSPDSNEVALSTTWDTPAIISATSNPATGKIQFVFQNGSGTDVTPDWGSPDSVITLRVIQTNTGAVVFDQSGITSTVYTPSKAFERLTHTATMSVTTSTGVNLGESAPITISFPKPTTPEVVKNFSSDDKGIATIAPNRLTWTDVTCSTSSTPEYLITHDNGVLKSEWISGTFYNIPETWLAQAKDETFTIEARCTNGNGVSSNSPQATVTFTTGILPPAMVTGLKVVNRGNVIQWTAANCAVGTTAEYIIHQDRKNTAHIDMDYNTVNPTYTLEGLTAGSDQSVAVAARCVVKTAQGAVSGASAFTGFTVPLVWTTLLPKPDAPTLTLVKKTIISNTEATYQLSWNTVANAQNYAVYNSTNMTEAMAIMGTLNSSTTITLKRGTTIDVVLRAENQDNVSLNSNKVALKDVWPTPKVISAESYPYEGTIKVVWQKGTLEAPTPDWGGADSRVDIAIQNSVTGATRHYKNSAAHEYTTEDTWAAKDRQDQLVTITVTTSTGDKLVSAPFTVNFPPPGPPAPVANLVSNKLGTGAIKDNRLNWDAVTCGGATPEYFVTNTDGSGNSGWVPGSVVGKKVNYDLPQEWLKQGFDETFTVAARCVNPNGPSAASADMSVTFIATILTPANVAGVKNNGVDVVSWTQSADAPTGLTRQYQITTVKVNNVAKIETYQTNNTSYQLTNLAPDTNQEVYVQVRYYNPANNMTSAWSNKVAGNTTAWLTPLPTPAAPVIKLDGTKIASPTENEYTISWANVQWATSYDVYAGTTKVATIDSPTLNAKFNLKRGTTNNVTVKAKNRSGTSVASNTLALKDTWPAAAILTAVGSQDGKISYTWQTGTGTNLTPDWGTPGYKISLEVSKTSDMASPIYTVADLTSVGHTTDVVAPATADRQATKYYSRIKVTTATGVVLTSAVNTMTFPVPNTPATPTGFNSNGAGTGPIKNDRLIWDNVTCTSAGSTPQYHIALWNDDTNAAVSGRTNYPTVNYFNIPQAWLIQGDDQKYRLLARCVFPNGDYSAWATPYQYHTFAVGIVTPAAPTNLAQPNKTNNTITWKASVCATGTTAEYLITKSLHNGSASTLTYTTTALTYDMPSITAGEQQKITIQARCILTKDKTRMSGWSLDSTAFGWRAPLPKPVAPVLTKGSTTMNSNTVSTVSVSWNTVPNAENYTLYNATTGAVLATVDAPTTSATVTVNRGNNAADAVKVNVKAGNFTYAVAGNPASNTLTLTTPWPAAKVLSAKSNQSKQIVVTWQTDNTTPDWGGNGSRVKVIVEQPVGTVVYTSAAQSGLSMTTGALPDAAASSVYIEVTTANGEVLTSPKVAVNFIMPAKPAPVTNLKAVNGTGPINPSRLTWTAVKCTVADTIPQYYVRQFVVDSTTVAKSNYSGWSIDTPSFDIPQNTLTQGDIYTYGVFARCISANGESSYDPVVLVTAARTNVLPPAAVTNLKVSSNTSDGKATLTWSAVSCPSGLTAGYLVYYVTKNDAADTTNAHAYTNTTLNITGLTPGTAHSVYVVSRCYNADDTTITSTWATGNKSATVGWATPIPVPAKTTLTTSQTSDNTAAGTTSNALKWTAQTWATSYSVYDVTAAKVVYTGTALTYNAVVKKNTTNQYYVIVNNGSGSSPNSNTVTIAPKYKTPVFLTSSADDFTLQGKWTYDALSNWGTGATAKIISTGYHTSTAQTAASYTLNSLPVGTKSWYLQVTTVTGVVLNSSSVSLNIADRPTVAVTYGVNIQSLDYTVKALSTYGLTPSTGSGTVQVSDTTSFAKLYSQSDATVASASATTAQAGQPTHGGTYYVRYVVKRNSDGKTIVSPNATVKVAQKSIAREYLGARTLPVQDKAVSGRIRWAAQWSGGNLNASGSIVDPRTTVGDCKSIYPILDFNGQGSQGIICWRNNGELYYYPIGSNGFLGAASVVGSGWQAFSEIAVIQNYFGDDKPAIFAIMGPGPYVGILRSYETNGNGTINSNYGDAGTGWHKTSSAQIGAITPWYDHTNYGDVGLIATSATNPWLRYYGMAKTRSSVGNGTINGAVSLLTSWTNAVNKTGDRSNFYPIAAHPNTKSSYTVARQYLSVVLNGEVVPAMGFGPTNYLDVLRGNGNGGFDSFQYFWGWDNNANIFYPGEYGAIG